MTDEGEQEEAPVWILDPDSWWVKLFGPYAGFMRYMVAWVLMISVFTAIMRIPGWVSKATSPAPPAPVVVPLYDTASAAGRIDRELSTVHEQLTHEIARAEAELNARKEALERLRANVDSLALTPTQRSLLGRSPPRVPPKLSFAEWLTDRNISYGIAINFVMGLFFYWLGARGTKRKHRPPA